MNRSYQEILDAATRPYVPDDIDLFPRIAAKLERKTLMQTLRARPALAILIVLIALSLLTGAVYAIGRSLGYIPGVGIVEQDTPIRVLAEPVSQTRDGITLTIDQAILTSDKTFIAYIVEGISSEARPKGEGGFACHPSTPTLLLPDGTELALNNGQGSGWGTGYQTGFYYPPIPADVDTVKFSLPCLEDVAPAAAPQDWELPLRFIPAPPELTVVPIIEIATPLPTPTAPASVSLAASDTFMGLSYHLESMKRTDRGYVLETSLHWDEGLYIDYGVGHGTDIMLTDASGQALHLSRLDYSAPVDPRRSSLKYSLDSLSFTAPLTLSLPWVVANLPQENRPQFTFDPGPNPQPGQEWQVNQTIDVLGQPVKIVSARYVTRADLQDKDWIRFMPEEMFGFEFSFEAGPAFRSIALSVQSGYSADGGGTSGAPTVCDENGIIKAYAMLGGKIISPLVIVVPYVDIAHSWQITFDPADIAIDAPAQTGASLDISLQIEKIIPIDDGYYLIGRTTWNDTSITEIGLGGWDTKMLDSNGGESPIEPAYFDEIGITDVQPDQWAFKVYGKALPPSLTLTIAQAMVQFTQPYTFTFDPGPNPQVGQEWQINQSLEILGHKATVLSAKFIQEGDFHGFQFSLTADPGIQGILLAIESGVVNGYGGGGGAWPRNENGVMKVNVLSDGQFGGPVLITIRDVVLNGNWETTWTPPVSSADVEPATVTQACVTLEQWKQATANPAALPSGLEGQIASMVNEGELLPTIYIGNLDGTDAQKVAVGSWASLSHDGTHLAYSAADGLHIIDLSSGTNMALGMDGYQIIWSPDDTRMMFTNTFNLYLVNADGSGLQSVDVDPAQVVSPIGWLQDGQTTLYSLLGEDGFNLKSHNLQKNHIKDLFTIQSKTGSAVLSPDGQWLAFLDHVPGKMASGLYLSRLDGSEKHLLVQLDYWVATTPLFSPDGKWIVFNVLNTDLPTAPFTPALLNLEDCQVVPLVDVNGEVRGWVK